MITAGCGSVWLERSVRDAEAARSNRAIPTIKKQTGSSEAGARFLFPKSGMCSLLCGACACDAGGRRGLASKRHSCRPAYAVCGSGCRGDPRGGAAGTLLPSIAAPFFAGHIRCPGLRCCSLPGGSECGERDCLAPSAIPEAGRQAAAFAQKMIFCAKVFDRTGRLLYIAFHNALVAQLDRATGYEPVGQEFESLRAHHHKDKRSAVMVGRFFALLLLRIFGMAGIRRDLSVLPRCPRDSGLLAHVLRVRAGWQEGRGPRQASVPLTGLRRRMPPPEDRGKGPACPQTTGKGRICP